jgi:transcriptional regulator with XRE-family HTH domain
MVDRERAQAFSRALRVLLQRHNFYVPLTGTYLLPQLYDRVRSVDGHGIHINTLRAYLRGDSLPSDGKVRLLADALGVPRGMLLYTAGYLAAEDLPHYPGPHATLDNIKADIEEVEALPLMPETKRRILRDLHSSARILQLLDAERASTGYATSPYEREEMIEQLISLWEAPNPAEFTSPDSVQRPTPQFATSEPATATSAPVARRSARHG